MAPRWRADAVAGIVDAVKTALPKVTRRPQVYTFSVRDLLHEIRGGRVRVPEFQRPQRWRSTHVIDLFDSMWRGFPIGSLLFSKGPAPAGTIHFGPSQVVAPALQDALFVVDGQQRVTALAGALLHPDKRPRGDIHALWFDLEEECFVRLTRAEAPLHWIPLNVLDGSVEQLRWLNEWALRTDRPDLVQRSLAVGQTIREYTIPAYIVDGASESALRVIFKRVNTAGVAMKEEEVFEALHGSGDRSLGAASARLSETGFGEIERRDLLDALKAVEGIDPRERFRDAEGDIDVSPEALERTEVAVRRVITFLVSIAGIPHVKLLPYKLPLRLLSRFFDLHPAPEARTLELLKRWVWRGALTKHHRDTSDATVSRLQACVGDDPVAATQALLAALPDDVAGFPTSVDRWNGREAVTRLFALAIFGAEPRDPTSGEVLDTEAIQGLLAEHDLGDIYFRVDDAESIAARFLVRSRDDMGLILSPSTLLQLPDLWRSHLLEGSIVDAFASGDLERGVALRGEILDRWSRTFFRERSGAGESDRPSIASILARVKATG